MALVLMVLLLVLMILACVLMVLALVMKVLTALALMLMIVAFSLMDSEVIYNPKKITHSLTYLVNNIGLRDASASKNLQTTKIFQCWKILQTTSIDANAWWVLMNFLTRKLIFSVVHSNMGQIHIYIIHKYVFAQYWCFEIIMISGALPWRWLHERHLRGRHGQESLEMDKKLYFGQQIQFSVVE